MPMALNIAKFKFHQYQLRAISPKLMLAKITHYMVIHVFFFFFFIFMAHMNNKSYITMKISRSMVFLVVYANMLACMITHSALHRRGHIPSSSYLCIYTMYLHTSL